MAKGNEFVCIGFVLSCNGERGYFVWSTYPLVVNAEAKIFSYRLRQVIERENFVKQRNNQPRIKFAGVLFTCGWTESPGTVDIQEFVRVTVRALVDNLVNSHSVILAKTVGEV